MSARRTHVVIPEPLVSEIDRVVGKRGRSGFLVHAAEKELRRMQQMKALGHAVGTWTDRNHPELKDGTSKWVNDLRKESDRRVTKSGR